MSQLTQLAFAYKVGREQKLPVGIDNFIDSCVIENKSELIKAVSVLKDYTPLYILKSFVCTIIKGMFVEKSQEQLQDIIGGGSIFKIHDQLYKAFLNDDEIKQTMEGK